MMEVRGIDKTFLEENILEEIGSLDEAISRASVLQQDYVVRERTARGQFSNTQGKIEVCFTGFSKADREELEKLATDKNCSFAQVSQRNLDY